MPMSSRFEPPTALREHFQLGTLAKTLLLLLPPGQKVAKSPDFFILMLSCHMLISTCHRNFIVFMSPSLDINDNVLLQLAATFLCSSLLFPQQVLFYYHFFYLVPFSFSFQLCTIKAPLFQSSPQLLKIIILSSSTWLLTLQSFFFAFLVSHLILSSFLHPFFPLKPPSLLS